MKKLCVIGSLNVDMTIRLPRFHEPGETITGMGFDIYAGGKGGNQAVAASRLGAQVLMVGKLGEDANGAFYRKTMEDNHVDYSGVETIAKASSGIALIEVDAQGENRIALVPGANAYVDRGQIDRILMRLDAYDIFLFQLEIPMDTVDYAVRTLHTLGKTVIVDPAPAMPIPHGFLAHVDYLTPNEKELALLTGMPTQTTRQVVDAAHMLTEQGARYVLAKVGARGVVCVTAESFVEILGYSVQAVDTTAAGDSFNAGFAWALAQDKPLMEACRIANAVGALSTMGAGAQREMATADQVHLFLNEQ